MNTVKADYFTYWDMPHSSTMYKGKYDSKTGRWAWDMFHDGMVVADIVVEHDTDAEIDMEAFEEIIK